MSRRTTSVRLTRTSSPPQRVYLWASRRYAPSMGTDVGRFLRLQGAIDAAAAAVPQEHAATAVTALVGSYVALREEVRAAIDEAFRAEFDRLFPAMTVPPAPNVRAGFDPFKSADIANEARTRLRTMGGWLGGFVREAGLE